MKKAFIILLIFCFSCNKSENLPNVILILTDDLGYNDVGFNGSTEIFTPNIDGIAKMVFYLVKVMFHIQCVDQVEQV